MSTTLIGHDPVWAEGPILMNDQGDTQPGFWCVYILENGNGPCGSSWFIKGTEQHYCGRWSDE